MTNSNEKLTDLLEINLLYAKLELTTARSDPSAVARALRHLEQALKDVRAERRAALNRSAGVNAQAA